MENEEEQIYASSKREVSLIPSSHSYIDAIRNRESWAKIAIAIILTALVSYKIATIDANLDFSNFNFSFTDLLSLILALFAISMSVALYFKATDTSNRFYDNTFKFTKDISEILGRIEAGFGARLKNLDEGYSGLRDSFQGSIGSSEEIDASKIELEKEIAEKNQILSDLIDQTKLSEDEKTEVLHSLQNKEREISNLTKELHTLRREINNNERLRESNLIHGVSPRIEDIIIDIINSSDMSLQSIIDMPTVFLRKRLKFDREKYSKSIYALLLNYGLISEENKFTVTGLEYIKQIAKKI